MRIDQLLVQRGLASTRSQAQRLIADGVEWLKMELSGEVWKRVAKNGDEVPDGAKIRLLDDSEARYVSRGGLKLEAALKQVGLSVTGLRCLDVGQSTGGFTDCLLQAGAQSVVGVDVGSAQLHPSLRSDPRVVSLEKTNMREVTVALIPLKNSDLMISELSTPRRSASSCTVRLPSGTISISGRWALSSRAARSSMARRRWRCRSCGGRVGDEGVEGADRA